MIMAWLWNSIIPKISDTHIFSSNAKQSWDATGSSLSTRDCSIADFEESATAMLPQFGYY